MPIKNELIGNYLQIAEHKNDPLHGKTLEMIVNHLVEYYGWEELGLKIRIKSFNHYPSVKSSLAFLRKTPWAREKVEGLYLYTLRQEKKSIRSLQPEPNKAEDINYELGVDANEPENKQIEQS